MDRELELSAAERRRARQREHIIEQAALLYAENGGEDGGFEATTVEAIAERSDISLRTFFRYFESKLDVIYLDGTQALDDLERFVRLRLETEPPSMAALNGRLDQLRYFCSSKSSRQRLRRALKAQQFRDRLNILRGKIEARIAGILFEQFDGASAERWMKAQLTASMVTTIVAPVLTPGNIRKDMDFESLSRQSADLLAQLHHEAIPG